MIRQIPTALVAAMVSLMIFTAILHADSLVRVTTLSDIGSRSSQTRLSWNRSAQVGLNFSNAGSHIKSDKDWNHRPKLFKLHPQSNDTYMVAMHQQLYCLDLLRKAYLSYFDFRSPLEDTEYADAEICIEQIRQHLMCNMDTTLEPTKLAMGPGGDFIPASNGIGVVHRCRDWRQLEDKVALY